MNQQDAFIGQEVVGGPGSNQPHGTTIRKDAAGVWRVVAIMSESEMVNAAQSLSINELVDRLRRAGAIWFRNADIILLEELIRRVNRMEREAILREAEGAESQ